jgi:hypothetical protein
VRFVRFSTPPQHEEDGLPRIMAGSGKRSKRSEGE